MKKTFNIKKLSALLLVLVMILSCAFSVSAFTNTDAISETATDISELSEKDAYTLSFESDEKAQDNSDDTAYICEIDNEDDYKNFVSSVNNDGLDYSTKVVNINADISFTDEVEPLKKFNGTINGNNHTFKNLKNCVLLYADKDAKILNLNVVSDISGDNAKANIGGIVSTNYGLVSGCTFSGSINSDDNQSEVATSGCGGIVGTNYGRIESCSTKEGSVINRDGAYGGGIAGISYILEDDVKNAVQPGIYSCTNNAEINCTAAEEKMMCGATGGIVGLFIVSCNDVDAMKSMSPQLANCTNNASINSQGAATAGIVGICCDAKVLNCTNNGAITQTGSLWTGGIIGSFNQENYYEVDESNKNDILYVNNCTNTATIKGVTRVGGIVGGDEKLTSLVGSQDLMNLNECTNSGDIFTTGYGGGISGYCTSDVNRCINTGNVTLDLSGQTDEQDGYNAVGGIVSRTNKTISNCINIGDVIVQADEPLPFTATSGGIIGIAERAAQAVHCYNSGAVYGSHESTTTESTTVYYGGVIGKGSTESINESVFNNTVGMAQRALASYIGEDSDTGLSIKEMTGENALSSMQSFFKDGEFEVATNISKDGVTYQLTPVLKNMPTPYELDETKTLSNASYAFVQVSFSEGEGYKATPVSGYDASHIELNGNFEFTLELDDAHKNDKVEVKVDGVQLGCDENGIYRLENLTQSKTVSITLVESTQPATENKNDNNDSKNNSKNNTTKTDNTAIKTGLDNFVLFASLCIVMLISFVVIAYCRKKRD